MRALRGLLLAALLWAPPAAALVLGHGGTLSGTSGTVVLTKTLENLSASTTPTIAGTTAIPTQFGIEFPPADVPAGNIVVPSVGGVTLTDAYVDSQQCSTWADGSLRMCPFSGFVPHLAGTASEQVKFTSTTGSWPTSSSIVPSSISSVTNIKNVLSNVNDSFVVSSPSKASVYWGVYPGFYVSGGSISGGIVSDIPTGTGADKLQLPNRRVGLYHPGELPNECQHDDHERQHCLNLYGDAVPL